ncbi:carbonic anhydrase-related protein 11 [Caerostris darwini]|uniref:Carbonic anhydrase-related protein 11 n=1 Tax=Caerostris darwini TaxID=1538125 RepID=A0AAV4X3F3_9ARAC|nr:carbonic anhydrase-related protein 11 [Caerostris darwini]
MSKSFESPDYWGLLNPDWKLCNRGRRQSPIDFDPLKLLYDPGMGVLNVSKEKANGTLINSGHSVQLVLDPHSPPVIIKGGPLSYNYRVHEILMHFGKSDDRGSEHRINGNMYPAEVSALLEICNVIRFFSCARELG